MATCGFTSRLFRPSTVALQLSDISRRCLRSVTRCTRWPRSRSAGGSDGPPFLAPVTSGSRAAGALRPQGCENNKIPTRLFFTLYILSIFTHEMYMMIGMHIIFLLTNSFNKALSICCSRLCFHSSHSSFLSAKNGGGADALLQSATRGSGDAASGRVYRE